MNASRRRDTTKMNAITRFCYAMTAERNRAWRGVLNRMLLVHVIILLLEAFPAVTLIEVRYAIFVFTTFCFALDSLMRLIGLGYKLFLRNNWNTIALIVAWTAFMTTLLAFAININSIYWNFNKIFLIGILMFLFPRSDRLNQLLTFASASFPSLFAMMFTWLVVVLVYAIAMNQIFGLMKLGPNTSSYIDFRSIPKALILLFRMSFGEEWNFIMQDFLLEPPSVPAARTLTTLTAGASFTGTSFSCHGTSYPCISC